MLEPIIVDKIVEQVVQQTVGWRILGVSLITAFAVSLIFWTVSVRMFSMSRTACLGKTVMAWLAAFFITLLGYSSYLEKDLETRIQNDPAQAAGMAAIRTQIEELQENVSVLKKNEEAYLASRRKNDKSLAAKVLGDDMASVASLFMSIGMVLGAAGTVLVRAIVVRAGKEEP